MIGSKTALQTAVTDSSSLNAGPSREDQQSKQKQQQQQQQLQQRTRSSPPLPPLVNMASNASLDSNRKMITLENNEQTIFKMFRGEVRR
jgi:transcription initiation factor TFIID subunit TAF12